MLGVIIIASQQSDHHAPFDGGLMSGRNGGVALLASVRVFRAWPLLQRRINGALSIQNCVGAGKCDAGPRSSRVKEHRPLPATWICSLNKLILNPSVSHGCPSYKG